MVVSVGVSMTICKLVVIVVCEIIRHFSTLEEKKIYH